MVLIGNNNTRGSLNISGQSSGFAGGQRLDGDISAAALGACAASTLGYRSLRRCSRVEFARNAGQIAAKPVRTHIDEPGTLPYKPRQSRRLAGGLERLRPLTS
jgi:hypothetical protein